jgi:hypothetical protein
MAQTLCVIMTLATFGYAHNWIGCVVTLVLWVSSYGLDQPRSR